MWVQYAPFRYPWRYSWLPSVIYSAPMKYPLLVTGVCRAKYRKRMPFSLSSCLYSRASDDIWYWHVCSGVPRNLVGGGVSNKFSWQRTDNGDLGGGSPLVRFLDAAVIGTRNFISYSKIFLNFGTLRLFMMTTDLFVIANVKELRTDGSFRVLLPFSRTSWGFGVLNSAIFNSFHNRVEFGTILEVLRNFGRGGWTPPLSVRHCVFA